MEAQAAAAAMLQPVAALLWALQENIAYYIIA